MKDSKISFFLGAFIGSFYLVSASAAKPGPVPQAPLPYPMHTVGELRDAIYDISEKRPDDTH